MSISTEGLDIKGKVIFSTGNIMSMSDITKKPSQNSTEELVEAIKFTLKNQKTKSNEFITDHLQMGSKGEEIQLKMQEIGFDDLKIGLKVFLINDNPALLEEALSQALQKQLNVPKVFDVIISFKNHSLDEAANQEPNLLDKSEFDNLNQIKPIWKCLETYVSKKIVGELGIADIEESTFKELYEWATIKPSIVQINLETCCVVPPGLQSFCKEKEVKLYTHNDSSVILPDKLVEEMFGNTLELQWAVRFTIHIKCRGVLTTKGYCICMDTKAK
ncbi:unnamed protein product [Ceutorhynchus assimilis]|uniref:GCS light chain n=1 Tax=Ceutorhynchus assimilis TaxID=467358 RepID=A0A9N9MCG0_9CUCU|nr:unnamed protein product [Ceutorhynchus assimilis]